VGGAAIVIDVGATRGAGGIEGAVWGAAKVMGAAWGGAKLVKQAMKEWHRSWRSDCQPIYKGDLTA
jgi:hypothetical protein